MSNGLSVTYRVKQSVCYLSLQGPARLNFNPLQITIVGTFKSAELKPDIDPLLFPPAQKPEPVPTPLRVNLKSNRRRKYSDFVPATDLMNPEPRLANNNKNGQPQEQDEYDDVYFAAAGSLSFTVLLVHV